MDSKEMAKKRWANFNAKERSAEMSRVSKARWSKRRKNKGKSKRTLDKGTIPTPNV